MKLKFDHMIHYVDQLKGFKYPGELLKIHSGGKHHQYGTFNRLTYINENYIELLDVEDVEKLKKEAEKQGLKKKYIKFVKFFFFGGGGVCVWYAL